MDAPPVRYTRTLDGKSIAYTVCGEGETLVFAPLLSNHVRYSWHFFRDWYETLAANFRFVAYDARGEGLSTRGLPENHRMSDWGLDLAAVIDAATTGPVVIMAGCHSSHVAVRYAIEHPDRVTALVLNTASMRMSSWGEAFWQHVPAENWNFFLRTILPARVLPGEARALLDDLQHMFSAAEMNAASKVMIHSTIEDEVAMLRTPTLVVHPRDMVLLSPQFGADLAARIPGARFALIDGDYVFGDATSGLKAIKDFLSEVLPASTEAPGSADLSARELEVLRLLATGRSNQQIADELVISLNTVRRHVSNIFDKTGVANRAQAAVYAKEHDLA